MRATAQMVSYEIGMGFVLVTVLMVAGTLNLTQIVVLQNTGWFADRGFNTLSWNWLPLLPLFVIYVVSSVAETNRHPFDVVEGESEIVAGHMVEYSGMSFAIFLAEYANMILLFGSRDDHVFGGWAAPIDLGRVFASRRLDGSRCCRPGSGCSPKSSSSCRCSSVFARLFRATAMTRSCVWAGRSSSRDRGVADRDRGVDADPVEYLEQ